MGRMNSPNPMPPPLRRMRRLATALLVLMALLFLLAHSLQARHPVWAMVRAFAEAALVGGLADWFAVTALFRQPLGLPIPHTAIIPANKDRLADGVAEFLQQNFLNRRVLAAQLQPLDAAAFIITALRDDTCRAWVARRGAALAGQFSPGELLAGWLNAQLQHQHHQPWFDRIADGARRLLVQHHAEIYQKVCEKSPRWMPQRVNDELYQRLMQGLLEMIDDLCLPDSAARLQFAQMLRDLAGQLAAGHHDQALVAALQLSEQSEQSEKSEQSEMPETSETPEDRPPGLLSQHLEMAMTRFADWLETAPERRAALNRWLQRRAVLLLVRRRAAIVGLVRRVIGSWDAGTVADRVEARVGRDLQFIRISGTLVGGVVGLLIHIISIFF